MRSIGKNISIIDKISSMLYIGYINVWEIRREDGHFMMQVLTTRFRLYIASFGILLSGVIAVGGFGTNVSAIVDNTPDCNDGVAIINCGAFSPQALRDKAARDDVPRIFNAFSISQSDLNGQFVDGIVWRDGRVTVEGKTVATGAMTAGRNFGGAPIAGTNAGKYPTSRFVTEGQTAFVRMVDGKFDFAVIKACGNPVSATPKNPPTPQEPEPAYECVSLTTEKLSRTKVRFTADAKASGGATIEKYEFGFGDGYGITVNEKSYTYDYKKTGTFETNVVVHVKVNGTIKKVTSRACEKNVTIRDEKTPEEEPCPYDSTLPKDSPDCKEDETPAVIAETGPGALLGGVVGSSALGYGAYSYLQSRRELLSKLLNR